MFKELPEDENHLKTRMILEHELKAAIRIIGFLVEKEGGKIDIPHSVLGTPYVINVYSSALSDTINLKSRIDETPDSRR